MKFTKEQQFAILRIRQRARQTQRRRERRFNGRDTVTWERGKNGGVKIGFGSDKPIAINVEQGLWWAQMLMTERRLNADQGATT